MLQLPIRGLQCGGSPQVLDVRAALGLTGEKLGTLSCEMLPHVIDSLAASAKASVHVDVLKGTNDHHRAEAAFKALALALKQAVEKTGSAEIPSTKGVL